METVLDKFTPVLDRVSPLMERMSAIIPESRTTQVVLAGAVGAVVIYQLTKKRYKSPPGPWGPPLIGNIMALQNSPLYLKLMEWEKTHGPVITVMFGPMKIICLNNFEMVQEAFVEKSADYAGRPQIYSMIQFTEGGKDIAFADYGPTWQLHRRLALKALGHYMKGNKFQELMEQALGMAVEELRKEKGVFDPKPHIEYAIFNLLSKMCFDEIFSKDDEEAMRFCSFFDQFNKEMGMGFWEDIIPPLRLWHTRKFAFLMKMVHEMFDYVYKRINQHRDTFNPEVQRDFTDAILLSQKEAEATENPELMAEFTDTHVGQTILDVFGAGIDTSRQTLLWAIQYVTAHPEVQRKLQVEIYEVLGSRRCPLVSDRNKLVYTEAVLFESMRCATVAPFAAPRTTTCDTTIGKYELPKGTTVMANVWAVHHDPKLFENPEEFKPERFLQGPRHQRPDGWMPFSVGKRACMAKSLAEPELILLFAGLYRNFEINLPEGVKADLTPDKQVPMGYFPKAFKVIAKYRD